MPSLHGLPSAGRQTQHDSCNLGRAFSCSGCIGETQYTCPSSNLQDIDLSPSFTIFLSTRDPTVEFRPDICSRVTMVNFTVTRSSLQMQCLNQVLKAERPDIDQKRSDLLKLQGEFQLRLRHLEKDLLQVRVCVTSFWGLPQMMSVVRGGGGIQTKEKSWGRIADKGEES